MNQINSVIKNYSIMIMIYFIEREKYHFIVIYYY